MKPFFYVYIVLVCVCVRVYVCMHECVNVRMDACMYLHIYENTLHLHIQWFDCSSREVFYAKSQVSVLTGLRLY